MRVYPATKNSMQGRILVVSAILMSAAAALVPAQDKTSASSTSAAKTLKVVQHVEHVEKLAREPMVVELSDGTLFVSGYDSEPDMKPNLWRSRDQGGSWELINVGKKEDGAIGNSDVDLARGPDDSLYFVNTGFDLKAMEGMHVAVGVSRDAGVTWSWKVISKNRGDDRPWVAVAPDEVAHLIWNDGNGVRHAVSRDHGQNWSIEPRINDQGGSSHLAVGPHGEVAVRIDPLSAAGNKFTAGVDLIAVSTDGGKSWVKRAAPGERDWSDKDDVGTPRWVEPLAWDGDGALYYFWGGRKGMWLARSGDQGVTWTQWQVVQSDEVCYFPYIIARDHGELAATWHCGLKDNIRTHVARIKIADAKVPPQLIEAEPFQAEIWSWIFPGHETDTVVHEAGGEYVPITFLRDGSLGVVTPIQNQREKRVGFTWWKFAER